MDSLLLIGSLNPHPSTPWFLVIHQGTALFALEDDTVNLMKDILDLNKRAWDKIAEKYDDRTIQALGETFIEFTSCSQREEEYWT